MNRFMLFIILMLSSSALAFAQDASPTTGLSKQSIAGPEGPYDEQGDRNFEADSSGGPVAVDASPQMLQDKQSIVGDAGPYDEKGNRNIQADTSPGQDHPVDEITPSTHQSKSTSAQY